jgi:hypothetical protein
VEGVVSLKVEKNFDVLDIFSWDIYRDPLHNFFSNIKIDI